MYNNFQDVLAALRGRNRLVIAVAVAQDEPVLAAIKMAYDRDLATAVLVGDAEKIKHLIPTVGLPPDTPVLHEPDDAAAAATAVALVKSGQAQILMKGLVNTAVFMKAILKADTGLRSGRMISHVSAFEIPGEEKLLFLTDVALNIAPSLEEKRDILLNAMHMLRDIGLTNPNVAILASNEVVSDKMPATVDAQALVKMSTEGVFPPGTVEGPLAMDVIAREEAANHKGIRSKIAGKVDLVLVPHIDTGNAVTKTLTHYAGAKFAGIVVGAANPVVVTSRAETAEGKLFSIALALLAYQGKQ